MISFCKFFEEVHGHRPFPWQRLLAERIADGGDWPQAVDLPTASGKTALIDIAVWNLAAEADLPAAERRTPRRVWFVVDRRIVVDEAYHRARKLADALRDNRKLGPMAEALRRRGRLSDQADPLAVARLRGGVRPDERWLETPSQPAILTSTADQFGSRLLFRAYGKGALAGPVHAALAGTDSLLVLDEAHCAVPLMQTVHAVQAYQSERWTPAPVAAPLRAVVMSATPPEGIGDVFPTPEQRGAALDDKLLHRRMGAAKPAELVLADAPKKPARGPRPPATLAPEAAGQVQAFLDAGKRRVAVMLNRVESAASTAALLEKKLRGKAIVLLLTGRMRPVDRDALLAEHAATLASNRDPDAESPAGLPVVLCTTQCLEVGADFSFDALVTECASLDALRQRFGRLDRLGEETGPNLATILAWAPDATDPASLDADAPLDPIYGNALARTWAWLNERAAASPDGTVDFGIDALESILPEDARPLTAPTRNAPVMLPAAVDAWCQTGPRPDPDPEVSVFLHGPDTDDDRVHVVFRHELTPAAPGEAAEARDRRWEESLDLVPPLAAEKLPVRRSRLVAWLAGEKPTTEDLDVEGVVAEEATSPKGGKGEPTFFVRIRGRRRKSIETLDDPRAVGRDDVIVLPAADGLPPSLGHGRSRGGSADAFDASRLLAGAPVRVRLTLGQVNGWLSRDDEPDVAGAAGLKAWLNALPEDQTDAALHDATDALGPGLLAEADRTEAPADHPLRHLAELLRLLPAGRGRRWSRHPAGGVVLWDDRVLEDELGEDPFADFTDGRSLTGKDQPLADHSTQVRDAAAAMAEACLPGELVAVVAAAADAHDLGKQDPRFQALLRGNAGPAPNSVPLAKSNRAPLGREESQRLSRALSLPQNWRHEALSMVLAERSPLPDAIPPEHRDLYLHLIASHHGHARPALPPVSDRAWADAPPQRLGSGVDDRFWSLVRKHGWWGLALIESCLRLADWHASQRPKETTGEPAPAEAPDA